MNRLPRPRDLSFTTTLDGRGHAAQGADREPSLDQAHERPTHLGQRVGWRVGLPTARLPRNFLSPRTYCGHARGILKKLGLHSRSQLATWITERGLPSPEQGARQL